MGRHGMVWCGMVWVGNGIGNGSGVDWCGADIACMAWLGVVVMVAGGIGMVLILHVWHGWVWYGVVMVMVMKIR